jgi:hypothetical protein
MMTILTSCYSHNITQIDRLIASSTIIYLVFAIGGREFGGYETSRDFQTLTTGDQEPEISLVYASA